jgi:hypothetical protein
MQKSFGLLIRADTQTVHDVDAGAWTDEEVRQKLPIGNDPVLRLSLERTGDLILVSGFLNGSAAGKGVRREGFDLYGERFFGSALIVSGEVNGSAPVLDPHDISRAIHFFLLNPAKASPAERRETAEVSQEMPHLAAGARV